MPVIICEHRRVVLMRKLLILEFVTKRAGAMNTIFEQKAKAIDYLEQSTTFPKEEVYFEFLRYLLKEEKEGNIVKSSTIALDVLNSDGASKGKMKDAYVRSKMLRLRKDLDLFYLKEGKNAPYKINIPKGKYKIDIEWQEEKKAAPSQNMAKASHNKKVQWGIILLNVVLFLCSLYFFLGQSTTPKESFVSLFVDKDAKVDILLGDRCFYAEYDSVFKRKRLIYDTDVHLTHTHRVVFDELNRKYPSRKIQVTRNFSHTDIGNIPLATKLAAEWGSKQLESSVHFSSLKREINENTVFISKTSSGDMYELLNPYFINSNCQFSINKITISSRGFIKSYQMPDTTISFKTSAKYTNNKTIVTSYCLIKKATSPKGHELLFLLPSNDAARNYINEKFFNSAFRQELLDSFEGKEMKEFELLLKISGGTFANAQSHKIIYNSVVDAADL